MGTTSIPERTCDGVSCGSSTTVSTSLTARALRPTDLRIFSKSRRTALVNWLITVPVLALERFDRILYLHRGEHPVLQPTKLLRLPRLGLPIIANSPLADSMLCLRSSRSPFGDQYRRGGKDALKTIPSARPALQFSIHAPFLGPAAPAYAKFPKRLSPDAHAFPS